MTDPSMKQRERFRIWDKDNKKIIINPIINDIDSATNYIGLNDLLKKYSDCGFELMQFTGLKDKNGKEIYEGDIVSVKYEGQGIIEYRKGAYMVNFNENTDLLGNVGAEEQDVEVLGNIYENPNLINN